MLGFRIWDIDHHKITYDIDKGFCIFPDGNLTNIWTIRSGPSYISQSDKFIPMQSTGLKDKNGKEIFEADVLKIRIAYEEGDEQVTYEVENAVMALIDLKEKDVICYTFHHMGNKTFSATIDGVIIGNIYENPELLERLK